MSRGLFAEQSEMLMAVESAGSLGVEMNKAQVTAFVIMMTNAHEKDIACVGNMLAVMGPEHADEVRDGSGPVYSHRFYTVQRPTGDGYAVAWNVHGIAMTVGWFRELLTARWWARALGAAVEVAEADRGE